MTKNCIKETGSCEGSNYRFESGQWAQLQHQGLVSKDQPDDLMQRVNLVRQERDQLRQQLQLLLEQKIHLEEQQHLLNIERQRIIEGLESMIKQQERH